MDPETGASHGEVKGYNMMVLVVIGCLSDESK